MKYDFSITKIDKHLAVDFVRRYHYSPVMPAITNYHLGFLLDDVLKGVLTLGYGTRPRHTFNKLFPKLNALQKDDNDKFIKPINDYFIQ